MAKLSKLQQEVLVGLLLGNGSLQSFNNGESFRFRYIQAERRKDYLFHVYDIFKELVATPPKLLVETHKNGEIYKKYYFNTLTSSSFKVFGTLFYKNKKKIVSPDIKGLITLRSLAFWFMDNGAKKGPRLKGFRLCTDCYDYNEVLFLSQILTNKFGLKTSLVKQRTKFRIFIKSESHEKFISQINDYLISSMKSKIS